MNIQAIKRGFLITLLTIIGVACAVCALAFMVASSTRNWLLEAAVMGAVATGYLLVIALACFAPLERGRFRWFAGAGLLATSFGIVVIPLWIWFTQRPYPSSPGSYETREIWERAFFIYFIAVGYMGFVPLVLLPRLKGAASLVQLGTVISMSAALVSIVLASWYPRTDELLERTVGASLIFSGGGSLFVYVLSRFFAAKTPQQLQDDPQMLHIRCPRCLIEQDVSVGESHCTHCKLRFKIDVEEPRCKHCHYLLRGLTRPICPECGTVFREEDLAATPVLAAGAGVGK